MRGKLRQVLAAGTAAVALTGLTACNNRSDVPQPQSSYSLVTSTPSVEPTPSDPDPDSEIRNDLAKVPRKKLKKAGPLSVRIEYETRLPVNKWQAGVSKPLLVSLTAVNKRDERQKIYLTKASAYVTAYDEDGPVDGPRTISDSANIDPGFIVTSPNTYNQSFALPAIDDTATRLTVDFTFELLVQVNKDKDGRNFAKQVATDSITVPIVS